MTLHKLYTFIYVNYFVIHVYCILSLSTIFCYTLEQSPFLVMGFNCLALLAREPPVLFCSVLIWSSKASYSDLHSLNPLCKGNGKQTSNRQMLYFGNDHLPVIRLFSVCCIIQFKSFCLQQGEGENNNMKTTQVHIKKNV